MNDFVEKTIKEFENLQVEEYGKWRIDRNVAKEFFRESLQSAIAQGKNEAVDSIKENCVWAKVNPVDECFLVTKPFLEELLESNQ